MADAFTYAGLATRVVFGDGTLPQAAGLVRELGGQRALVLCTPNQTAQADEVLELLGPLGAGRFDGAAMHTPVEVTAAAQAVLEELCADCLVAVGGGSTIGLGKALALRTGLPQLVIPTTYAGSEMTPILGETQDGLKTTRRGPEIQPECVLYDVALTLSLPPALSATSGINAIAHAVEGLYARDRNPVTSLMAEEGIRALAGALPAIVADPADRAARSDALYGAWLCGTVLGTVGMALHHKLCHTLGGSFGLPHAETHTVVLPHAVAYTAPAVPAAVERMSRALGGDPGSGGPAQALHALAARLGAPTSLREIGMPEDGIDRAADLAVANPYWNPRPIERDAIRDLLARAWAGLPPA